MVISRSTIPNLLTASRGLATLTIAVLFLTALPGRFALILIFLAYATATDFLDGYLARRWQVRSAFGEVFDPLLDKLLVLTMLLLLYPYGIIPAAAVIILFVRDVAIDSIKSFVLRQTGATTPAIRSAKYKTALQLVMLHAAVMALAFPDYQLVFMDVTRVTAVAAVIFSLYSAGIYLIGFRRALVDERTV